jgi:hypothetical protein
MAANAAPESLAPRSERICRMQIRDQPLARPAAIAALYMLRIYKAAIIPEKTGISANLFRYIASALKRTVIKASLLFTASNCAINAINIIYITLCAIFLNLLKIEKYQWKWNQRKDKNIY